MLMLRRGGINSKVHARVVKVTIIRMIRGIAKGGGGTAILCPSANLGFLPGKRSNFCTLPVTFLQQL